MKPQTLDLEQLEKAFNGRASGIHDDILRAVTGNSRPGGISKLCKG